MSEEEKRKEEIERELTEIEIQAIKKSIELEKLMGELGAEVVNRIFKRFMSDMGRKPTIKEANALVLRFLVNFLSNWNRVFVEKSYEEDVNYNNTVQTLKRLLYQKHAETEPQPN